MSTIDYSKREFEECIHWLEKKTDKKNCTIDELKMAFKENDINLKNFLQFQHEENDWPELTVEEWKGFVDFYDKMRKDQKPCIIPPQPSVSGADDRIVPQSDRTAWGAYKKLLLDKRGFSLAAVTNIERSALAALNKLKEDTSNDGTAVKGLIMGNVQSGKTANMAGLISMAADYGWNLFIVLTGTIENLRRQTQSRFINDLKSGNIAWYTLDNPWNRNDSGQLQRLEIESDSRVRYVLCCLKNGARLRALHKWLNSAQKKAQLKVLLIDDEADQASLNTGNIDEEKERTAINRSIRDIVNNTDKAEKSRLSRIEKDNLQIPYRSMNYVCYTATPYGNFLNESGTDSLYPKDFISVLTPSDLYFGPEQIFGNGKTLSGTSLPVLNNIPGDYPLHLGDDSTGDIAQIEAICENPANELPNSLKKAIAWFCVAVAMQRVWQYKKPVTMLVHHSMMTEKHANLGRAILNWLYNVETSEFLNLCQTVYEKQTKQLSKVAFKSCWPEYGQYSGIDIDRDIRDYPDYTELIPHLNKLKSKINHIKMDSTGALLFDTGIHLCIDNCTNQVIVNDDTSYGSHVRLIYPEKDQSPCDAPAFLVIGGNTLSRGLTLEGLVCTYFSREVKQADSLMQMARWFGFRRGYELLPRIWLTASAQQRFEFLTLLDDELRQDLYTYEGQKTPLDCGPLILQTPAATKMILTSTHKSQSMIEAEMDFSGANLQTFNFLNDLDMLERQLDAANQFVNYLAEPSFEVSGRRKIWENVSFQDIWNRLLQHIEWPFSQTMDIHDFKDWYDSVAKEHQLRNWDVVLAGKDTDKVHRWHGVGKVTRTRKISGMNTADSKSICIGVLSDPSEWHYDIHSDDTFSNSLPTTEKIKIRDKYGKKDVPLLVMYCIDKDSRPAEKAVLRQPLRTAVDVIGISIHIPGSRLNRDFCAKVRIKLDDTID